MPEALNDFLRSLDDVQRREVWKWLDEQEYAVHQMIDLLAECAADKGTL